MSTALLIREVASSVNLNWVHLKDYTASRSKSQSMNDLSLYLADGISPTPDAECTALNAVLVAVHIQQAVCYTYTNATSPKWAYVEISLPVPYCLYKGTATGSGTSIAYPILTTESASRPIDNPTPLTVEIDKWIAPSNIDTQYVRMRASAGQAENYGNVSFECYYIGAE